MENNIPESNNRGLESSETAKLKSKTEEPLNPRHISPEQEEPIEKLLQKVGQTALVVNRLDYFANTIPLGAFCNALAFILYGFCEAKVYKIDDSNLEYLKIVILLFGAVGQLTTGFLEYIKGRTFITAVYLLYGLYFLSLYLIYELNVTASAKIFYGAWACLSFPLIIGSIKTNVFYIIQTVIICLFFVLRCIGECKNKNVLRETVSGVFQLVGGFVSLYICISQVINENFRACIIPCIALQEDNEIDIVNKKNKENKEE